MSNDLNRCEFIGRVGSIETRYTADGKAITNLSLACNESWKKNGEKQESTEWVRVCVFGQLTEIAKKYVEKGSQLYIAGKLKTRKWQDKQGQDRYTTEIVVDGFNGVMQMLGGKGDNNQAKPQSESQGSQQYQKDAQQAQQFDNNFDNDIPF